MTPVGDVGLDLAAAEPGAVDRFGLRVNAVIARVLVTGRGAQDEADTVGRLEQQGSAHAIFADAGKIGLPRQLVLEPAIRTRDGDRNARRESIAQRHVECAVQLHPVVIAIAEVEIALGLAEPWRAADQIDRAAGGVLAVKRALRAAQHLDALKVEHRDAQEREIALVDLVIIGCDRACLVQAVVGHGNAAQREDRCVVADGRGELEVGDLADEFVSLGNALFLERIARNGRDRDRDVLKAFGPLLRGHDDIGAHLFRGGLCRRSLLRDGGGGRAGK